MKIEQIIKEFAEAVNGVKSFNTMTFNENLVLASGCNPYGCTCISHEKCCGCFLQ